MKRNINKHGKKLIILMALMILTLSFALFSDSKDNKFEGQMHTLGIETEFNSDKGNVVDGVFQLNGLYLPGQTVEIPLSVWQNESYKVNEKEVAAAAARVRHRIELVNVDEDSIFKPENFSFIVMSDGIELEFVDDSLTTISYKVEPNGKLDAENITLKIILSESIGNLAQGLKFEAKIITEAIQWDYSNENDFEGDNVVRIENAVAPRVTP